MKRAIIIITAVLLCITSVLRAQNVPVVQIGTGIDTSEYLPTNVFSGYGLSQQIYTASEIGQSGTIYGIAFYNISPDVNRDLDVYLVHTNKTAFANDTDWTAVTAGDLVFSGNVTFMQDQWGLIELSTPFVYNGTDNLLVVVDDNSYGWVYDRYFRVFDAPNQAMFVNDDYTDYNPAAPGGYDGSVSSVKNQIQLSFVPAPCPAPTSLSISNISTTYATLSWTENGSATAWDICLDGNLNNIISVDTNPYVLTGLTPNTSYTVMIRANCGGGNDVSTWLTGNFLTSLCGTPSDVYISDVSQTSATLNWTETGTATVWEVSLDGDYENAITVYTNPYVLTGLTPNTPYIVEIRANCGDSNMLSYWTNASFTTLSDYQVQSTAHWYGYAFNSRMENGDPSNYDWEKEFVSFSMQDPSTVTAITDMNLQFPYTYAAAYANGYVWCITREDGHLCRALINDETQTISDFEIVVPYFEIGILRSMAFNYVDGRMYYITTENALKRFDLSQPEEFTYVGLFNFEAIALAINHFGEAYVLEANSTGNLYQLDLDDASVNLIGSTGLSAQYEQSMAFDQGTGELFWAQFYNVFGGSGLYLVDPTTASTQNLGRVGGVGCQLAGLLMVDTSQHVGVPTRQSDDILLYPNPATDIVNVQCAMNGEQWDVETIEVLDVYGKVVRTIVETRHGTSLQTARINVAGLSSGLYFVRVTTVTGQITRPFVKN
jgi:hypothetical protein